MVWFQLSITDTPLLWIDHARSIKKYCTYIWQFTQLVSNSFSFFLVLELTVYALHHKKAYR